MYRQMQQEDPQQEIRTAMAMIDRQKKGFIPVSELRAKLTKMGEKLSEEEGMVSHGRLRPELCPLRLHRPALEGDGMVKSLRPVSTQIRLHYECSTPLGSGAGGELHAFYLRRHVLGHAAIEVPLSLPASSHGCGASLQCEGSTERGTLQRRTRSSSSRGCLLICPKEARYQRATRGRAGPTQELLQGDSHKPNLC